VGLSPDPCSHPHKVRSFIPQQRALPLTPATIPSSICLSICLSAIYNSFSPIVCFIYHHFEDTALFRFLDFLNMLDKCYVVCVGRTVEQSKAFHGRTNVVVGQMSVGQKSLLHVGLHIIIISLKLGQFIDDWSNNIASQLNLHW
jgi:hypothetical protein